MKKKAKKRTRAKKRPTRAQKKVHKVLHEFKEGTLKSSSGQTVTKPSQAKAIAMSEAGLSKKKRKAKKTTRKRTKSRKRK